jgi:cobalamin transport system substrate-binding protein
VRQRIVPIILLLYLAQLALAANPPKPAAQPLVASVVPAATDLIVGMGAGDHLVGVSNYDDTTRPELSHLPRIGDYQTIDWERLRILKPRILIIFQSPDRISPGVKERAAKLNLKLVNVHPETLDDVYTELKNLGEILNEPSKAKEAAQKLETDLQSIRDSVKDKPKVRTLILRDETATATVGRGTFLNDILELSGGKNAIEDNGWPTIDRERLTALNPDAIIILLSASPPQLEKQATATLQRMPHLTAVKTQKIKIINLWYSQQPGLHLSDLAKEFANFLHPEPSAQLEPPSSGCQADALLGKFSKKKLTAETQRRRDAEKEKSKSRSSPRHCIPASARFPSFHPRYLDRLAAAVSTGHRRASDSKIAPAPSPLFLPPPTPSSPQLYFNNASSKPPQVALPKRIFRGVAGGVLPPCVCAFSGAHSTTTLSTPPTPFKVINLQIPTSP